MLENSTFQKETGLAQTPIKWSLSWFENLEAWWREKKEGFAFYTEISCFKTEQFKNNSRLDFLKKNNESIKPGYACVMPLGRWNLIFWFASAPAWIFFFCRIKIFHRSSQIVFSNNEAPESDKIGIQPCSNVRIGFTQHLWLLFGFPFSISGQLDYPKICPFLEDVERGSE